MPSREKRLKRYVTYLPPSLGEQLELFKGEESRVLSMSDYLHDVIEEHIAMRSIRISKQKIGRRAGNS